VVDEQPEKNTPDVSEVTCRVVMAFKIRVRGITPERVANEFPPVMT
jgi:hypothetical protein